MIFRTIALALPCLAAAASAQQIPFQSPLRAHDKPRAVDLFAPARQLLVGDGPTALASGDFDGNGYDDLAVAVAGDAASPRQELVIFMSDALGQHFSSVQIVDLPPQAVVAADLDGDGDIDIATVGLETTSATFHNTTFSVLENTGGGNFASARTFVLPDTQGSLELVAGHFDAAGMDLVIAHRFGLWMATSGASLDFVVSDQFSLVDARSLNAADVDGDGSDDVVVIVTFVSPVTGAVIFGDGAGQFRSTGAADSQFFPVEVGPWVKVRPVDLDADGDLDMVSSRGAGQTAGRIRYNPNMHGVFPPLLALNSVEGVFDGQDLLVADFDGDGRPDLAGSSRSRGNVELFLHQGRRPSLPRLFASIGSIATGAGATALASGDLNADGVVDLICVNADEGAVSVLIGNGP
jgi:hypothetical protein